MICFLVSGILAYARILNVLSILCFAKVNKKLRIILLVTKGVWPDLYGNTRRDFATFFSPFIITFQASNVWQLFSLTEQTKNFESTKNGTGKL